jgi:hypothetical protein
VEGRFRATSVRGAWATERRWDVGRDSSAARCYDVARDGATLPGIARRRLVAPEVRGRGAVVVRDRSGARLPRQQRFPGTAPPRHHGAHGAAGRRAGPGLRPADVLGDLPERNRGGRVFRCRCACGRETAARAVELRQGKVRSCGCLLDEARQSGHTRPPSVHGGQRYGRLVVLHEAGRQSPRDARSFSCRCDCGSTTTVRGANLTSGHTRSCGCLLEEYHQRGGRARPTAVGSG